MSTTIHLPSELLAAVDRQARDLDMSRNRYIIRALECSLETETEWSAAFVEEFAAARADVEGHRALDELRTAIAAGRSHVHRH